MNVLNLSSTAVAAAVEEMACINNATCGYMNYTDYIADYQYSLLSWIEKDNELLEREKAWQLSYEKSAITANACCLKDFLKMQFSPKKELWGPILRSHECMMIFAARGLGKTLFAMQLAVTLAGGGSFLKYHCENPCKVLYVDGEMPGITLQERVILALKQLSEVKSELAVNNLTIITPDLQTNGIPIISSDKGQLWLKSQVQSADVIFFDSLLTLNPATNDNDLASFIDMNHYLMTLRKAGKSVIMIHHAGKNGNQLGTSHHETLLDTVIKLSIIDKDDDGIDKIRLEYTKHRNFYGNDTKPFIIKYSDKWEWNTEIDVVKDKVIEMSNLNITQCDIAKELGISQSTVSRILNKQKVN